MDVVDSLPLDSDNVIVVSSSSSSSDEDNNAEKLQNEEDDTISIISDEEEVDLPTDEVVVVSKEEDNNSGSDESSTNEPSSSTTTSSKSKQEEEEYEKDKAVETTIIESLTPELATKLSALAKTFVSSNDSFSLKQARLFMESSLNVSLKPVKKQLKAIVTTALSTHTRDTKLMSRISDSLTKGLCSIYNYIISTTSSNNQLLLQVEGMQCFLDISDYSSSFKKQALYFAKALGVLIYKETTETESSSSSSFKILQSFCTNYNLLRLGIKTTNNNSKSSAKTLLGWEPVKNVLPQNVIENSGKKLSVYKVLENSLLSCFYAESIGSSIPMASFHQVLFCIEKLSPYKGPSQLLIEEYVDECFLIARVVLTISNFGTLLLQKDDLLLEYYFIRENFNYVLSHSHVSLVAEFTKCLIIFNNKDEDDNYLIRRGIEFLLESNTNASDKKSFRMAIASSSTLALYYARTNNTLSLNEISSSSSPVFSTVARVLGAKHRLVLQKQQNEKIKTYLQRDDLRLQDMERFISFQVNRVNIQKKKKNPVTTNSSTLKTVLKLKETLNSTTTPLVLSQTLDTLDKLSISLDIMRDSLIGKTVRGVKKSMLSVAPEVSQKANALVSKWKKQIS